MDERPLDLAVLRTFSPLDGLKAENLHALARKTHIRELAAGRVLFKEGDTDKRTYYGRKINSSARYAPALPKRVRHWLRVCRESLPRVRRSTSSTS